MLSLPRRTKSRCPTHANSFPAGGAAASVCAVRGRNPALPPFPPPEATLLWPGRDTPANPPPSRRRRRRLRASGASGASGAPCVLLPTRRPWQRPQRSPHPRLRRAVQRRELPCHDAVVAVQWTQGKLRRRLFAGALGMRCCGVHCGSACSAVSKRVAWCATGYRRCEARWCVQWLWRRVVPLRLLLGMLIAAVCCLFV